MKLRGVHYIIVSLRLNAIILAWQNRKRDIHGFVVARIINTSWTWIRIAHLRTTQTAVATTVVLSVCYINK